MWPVPTSSYASSIFILRSFPVCFGSSTTLQDALIYVIDSTDRRRLEESSRELQRLLLEEQLADIPILVRLGLKASFTLEGYRCPRDG